MGQRQVWRTGRYSDPMLVWIFPSRRRVSCEPSRLVLGNQRGLVAQVPDLFSFCYFQLHLDRLLVFRPRPLLRIDDGDDPQRGADILELCDGERTVAEIVAELRGRYAHVVDEDVRRFLDGLAARRCLEVDRDE